MRRLIIIFTILAFSACLMVSIAKANVSTPKIGDLKDEAAYRVYALDNWQDPLSTSQPLAMGQKSIIDFGHVPGKLGSSLNKKSGALEILFDYFPAQTGKYFFSFITFGDRNSLENISYQISFQRTNNKASVHSLTIMPEGENIFFSEPLEISLLKGIPYRVYILCRAKEFIYLNGSLAIKTPKDNGFSGIAKIVDINKDHFAEVALKKAQKDKEQSKIINSKSSDRKPKTPMKLEPTQKYKVEKDNSSKAKSNSKATNDIKSKGNSIAPRDGKAIKLQPLSTVNTN